jgi:amidase
VASLSDLIDDASIVQLLERQESGALTARGLTEYYLEHINLTQGSINAFIALNPKALSEASRLDSERADGSELGRLHGIPILIKDNIETKDMATTAGSLFLKDNYTERDAPLVTRLKDAGAIILGKANLSEWANFRSTHSSSGWSAMGGQVRNPHDLTRSPGGSSAGSGAAVAANLAAAAVGTETSGSILCPASLMGLVGLKPTVGLISRRHIVPISHNQDTAGPMTRFVEDAALLLEVMAGYDSEDQATEILTPESEFGFSSAMGGVDLTDRRIGVVRPHAAFIHYETADVFERAIGKLEEAGALLIHDVKMKDPYPKYHKDGLTIMLHEFKVGTNSYLETLNEPFNTLTLEDLIRFNRDHAEAEMPHFRQELLERAEACGGLEEPKYLEALDRAQTYAKSAIDEVLKESEADLYVSLSMDHAWPIDHVGGDRGAWSNFETPAIAGYPHLTVPMGKVRGLPVGLSFVGRPLSDGMLLATGKAFEAVRGTV